MAVIGFAWSSLFLPGSEWYSLVVTGSHCFHYALATSKWSPPVLTVFTGLHTRPYSFILVLTRQHRFSVVLTFAAMSPMDEEKGDAMNGYSRLASYMGEGAEIAMFKRFTALNAHNLLLYQAELSELEKKLTEAIEKDEASGDFRRMLYDRYLVALQCSETDIDGNTEQLNTLRQIRKTLKEYSMYPHSSLGQALIHHQMRHFLCRGVSWNLTIHISEMSSICKTGSGIPMTVLFAF